MDARIRNGALLLAAVALTGCSLGTRLGWRADRVEPTAEIRAVCETNVRSIKSSPDYDTALRACIAAKSRQSRRVMRG